MLKEYLDINMCCHGYTSPTSAVFRIYEIPPHNDHQTVNIDESVILFVLEGELCVSCNEFKNRNIAAGEMVLLPCGSNTYAVASTGVRILSCTFMRTLQFCNRYALECLSQEIKRENLSYDFTVLPVHQHLATLVDLLYNTLTDGLGCIHYHKSADELLFILMRSYYTRAELALFFYPLLGAELTFKESVFSYYTQVDSVDELASALHMSTSTFNRHFRKAFNETAHQWITKRKSESVYMDISLTKTPFSEVAFAHNFSSTAYFAAYCKKHFGKTPQEIRDEANYSCIPKKK